MSKKVLSFILNGEPFNCYADDGASLCELLFPDMTTASRCGCNRQGGAVVLVNGVAIDSALCIAATVSNCNVYTFDGLHKHIDMQNLISAFNSVGVQRNSRCFDDLLVSAASILCRDGAPTRADLSGTFSGITCREVKMDQIISAIEKAYTVNIFEFIEKAQTPTVERFETLDPDLVQKMTIMLPEANGLELMETPIKIATKPITVTPRNSEVQEVTVTPTVTPTEPVVQETPALVSSSTLEVPEVSAPISTTVEPDPPQPATESSPTIDEPQSETQPAMEEPVDQENVTVPASIFDESFIESMEKGKKPKVEHKDKEKTGFFSKFTAAFRDKHHKTLELPDIEDEE